LETSLNSYPKSDENTRGLQGEWDVTAQREIKALCLVLSVPSTLLVLVTFTPPFSEWSDELSSLPWTTLPLSSGRQIYFVVDLWSLIPYDGTCHPPWHVQSI
jgi:hypothetical protein